MLIIIFFIPVLNRCSIALSRIVEPEIISIGLGMRSVRGNILSPRHAAIIIALSGMIQGLAGSVSRNILNQRFSDRFLHLQRSRKHYLVTIPVVVSYEAE